MPDQTIPQRDEMLFHDLVAIAARVEDEARRVRDLTCVPGVSPDVAHQAGIAYTMLEELERLMFRTACAVSSLAPDISPEAAHHVSERWHDTKQACREARRLARETRAQRLSISDAAVSG